MPPDELSLFGDSEPYGPKADRPNPPGGVHRGRLNSGDANRFQAGERHAQSENNPLGAPPLDWWLIEEED